MVLPQTCSNPAAFQDSSCTCTMILTLHSRIWERSSWRCDLWVTLLRPDVGASKWDAVSLQSQNAFEFKLEGSGLVKIIEVDFNGANRGDGKQWAKMCVYICHSWVRSSVAEIPMPELTLEMQPHFTCVKTLQCLILGLCVGNGARCSMFIFRFSEICFHPRHHF